MIGAIILAAGSSRRFGDDKRKALLPNGKMVIEQTTENVLECFDEVLLVLRYGDAEFEAQLLTQINNPKLRIFRAPDSALGMGSSLANAIHEVKNWEGAFVFLGDMPYIEQGTIQTLQNAMTSSSSSRPERLKGAERRDLSNRPSGSVEMTGLIVVPTNNGTYGHPVGFHSSCFEELAQLSGDTGARPVINAHKSCVIEIAVRDQGIVKDVDHPQDL